MSPTPPRPSDTDPEVPAVEAPQNPASEATRKQESEATRKQESEATRKQESEPPRKQESEATRKQGSEAPRKPASEAPRRLGLPYGLFIALALYAVACLGYVWATYWSSPDYVAAQHYAAAWDILGSTQDGRKATRDQLVEAYKHLLEVGRLRPEIRTVHEQLESLNWRFEERRLKLPQDLRHNADAVAMTWQNIQKSNEPILVVGVRDRGWAPAQVLDGPARVATWSPVGGLLIIALWAWWRFGAMRKQTAKKDADHEELANTGRELDKQRDRMRKQRPDDR